MCSSAGDIEDISDCSKQIRDNISKDLFQKCKKCLEQSVVLLQKKDPFCRSCFLEYCNHKFRSTIGKSKKIKHGEKVLLTYSGGRKSAALLHMTLQTLKSASAKQISFFPAILFIDETFLENLTNASLKLNESNVLKQLKSVNYPVLYSSLEMVYKINSQESLYSSIEESFTSDTLSVKKELREKLNSSFKVMPLSSKIDYLKHLRLLLITEIAHQAGYNSIFLGDTASSLAVELLSNLSLGRGSQISPDTRFYDTRYKVSICRPLREFLDKEIAFYNHLNAIVYDVFPDFCTKTYANSSIQRLTETFLSNLQEKFPATIFTVFRTGGKLAKNIVNISKSICIVCKSEQDNINPDPCSALEALKLSQKLSSKCQKTEENASVDLCQFMCHGCSTIFQKMNKPEYFQYLIPETSLVQMNRHMMKEEIKEFLIEDC